MNTMGYVKRAAWVVVAGFALGLSWWSLAYVARSWGVPWLLSWVASAVFDGVALICADLALRAARAGDSTFAPSSCLMIFAGLSAWFNSWHAQLNGLPAAARIFYACPPLAAVAVTELQLRHDRRAALRTAGRVADPLPALGGVTWFHHPWASYAAQRKITRHRLNLKLRLATMPPAALKSSAAGGPSQAGATSRPRKSRPASPAPSGSGTRLDPVRRAELIDRIARDLAGGAELSKRSVPDLYGVTAWQGEVLLAEARKIAAELVPA